MKVIISLIHKKNFDRYLLLLNLQQIIIIVITQHKI